MNGKGAVVVVVYDAVVDVTFFQSVPGIGDFFTVFLDPPTLPYHRHATRFVVDMDYMSACC